MASACSNTDLDKKSTTSECNKSWELSTKLYAEQLKSWPQSGQHILAQFDDVSVVVYQAFNKEIANFAVANQRFGGPHYSFERMSWIKPNFMWMMYRCGWAQKRNQERVLAIRITREGFEDILSKAYTAGRQRCEGLTKTDIEVRLQWDPDHNPHGGKLARRAIQLGLKGKTLQAFGVDHILNIKDITSFVHKQFSVLKNQGLNRIISPHEEVFIPSMDKTSENIGLDQHCETKVFFTS